MRHQRWVPDLPLLVPALLSETRDAGWNVFAQALHVPAACAWHGGDDAWWQMPGLREYAGDVHDERAYGAAWVGCVRHECAPYEPKAWLAPSIKALAWRTARVPDRKNRAARANKPTWKPLYASYLLEDYCMQLPGGSVRQGTYAWKFRMRVWGFSGNLFYGTLFLRFLLGSAH